jgi:hypothetical protein
MQGYSPWGGGTLEHGQLLRLNSKGTSGWSYSPHRSSHCRLAANQMAAVAAELSLQGEAEEERHR